MLNKLLPYKDKEKIVSYINDYALYGVKKDYLAIDKIDYILREWAANKEFFFSKFNNNFIIEKDIVIKNEFNSIMKNIEILFSKDLQCLDFFNKFYSFFTNTTYFSFGEFSAIRSLFSIDTLAKGKYTGENIKIYNNKTNKYIQINFGCKPLKTLQKICLSFEICSEEEFKNFRNKISTVLNIKELKGKLCLSIHPLDFLTMSDNNNGWSSCMSIIDEGSYRQGAVEMMNSSYVIIGYLKSSNDKNDEFLNMWNSKKWRELYIVNKEDRFISNIKSYPYKHETLSLECVKWLQEIFFPKNKIYKSNNLFVRKDDISFSVRPSTNNMYNDFGNPYTLFYSIDPENKKEEYVFNYSGACECLCCGELNFDLYENYLCCEECLQIAKCSECGDIFDIDKMYDSPEGELLCKHCYERKREEEEEYER